MWIQYTKTYFLSLVMLIFVLVAGACTDNAISREVFLAVDVLPQRLELHYDRIDHFLLNWFDERARYRSRRISGADLRRAFVSSHTNRTLSVSLAPHQFSPLLLMPVARNGARFSPAGALFPITEQSGAHLVLKWDIGCAIAPLMRSFAQTDGLYGFNAERYLREFTQQQGENPCWIDDDRLVALLQRRAFRTNAFRARDLHDLEITFPRGEWHATNIFFEARASDGIISQQLEIPYGTMYFFDRDTARMLRLAFTDKEVIVVAAPLN